jgi:hypothetical protein
MTPEEIVRELRRLRYSPPKKRMGVSAVNLRSIARTADVSHMTLYRAIYTGEISARSASALGPVLESVTNEQNQKPRSPAPFLGPAERTITLKIRWPFDTK